MKRDIQKAIYSLGAVKGSKVAFFFEKEEDIITDIKEACESIGCVTTYNENENGVFAAFTDCQQGKAEFVIDTNSNEGDSLSWEEFISLKKFAADWEIENMLAKQ